MSNTSFSPTAVAYHYSLKPLYNLEQSAFESATQSKVFRAKQACIVVLGGTESVLLIAIRLVATPIIALANRAVFQRNLPNVTRNLNQFQKSLARLIKNTWKYTAISFQVARGKQSFQHDPFVAKEVKNPPTLPAHPETQAAPGVSATSSQELQNLQSEIETLRERNQELVNTNETLQKKNQEHKSALYIANSSVTVLQNELEAARSKEPKIKELQEKLTSLQTSHLKTLNEKNQENDALKEQVLKLTNELENALDNLANHIGDKVEIQNKYLELLNRVATISQKSTSAREQVVDALIL